MHHTIQICDVLARIQCSQRLRSCKKNSRRGDPRDRPFEGIVNLIEGDHEDRPYGNDRVH